MSLYSASHEDGRSMAYGFDACGMPAYFVSDCDGTEYDQRGFMTDTGISSSRGDLVEILQKRKDEGFSISDDHLMAMALDLPF